jgi:hypothetical protein
MSGFLGEPPANIASIRHNRLLHEEEHALVNIGVTIAPTHQSLILN